MTDELKDEVNAVVEEQADEFMDEVKKRGAKNILEENKRKAQELEELKRKLAEKETPKHEPKVDPVSTTKYPIHIQKFYDKSLKAGVDRDWVETMCDTMLQTAVEAAEARATHHVGEFSKTTSRMVEKYQREMLNDSVESLAKDKKYKFVVEKHGAEIKKRVKEQFKPEFYDNEDVLKSVAGQILIENMQEETSEKTVEKIGESSNGGSAKGGQSVSEEALIDFANSINVDISNPEVKKKVKEAYLMRQRVIEKQK